MELASVIFPAPTCSYSDRDLDGLIWIPIAKENLESRNRKSFTNIFCLSSTEDQDNRTTSIEEYEWIPCLYLRYNEGSTKILIYFHGNAEDIGLAYDFLNTLKMELRVHVLAMEYPGYGLYKATPGADSINKDALAVFDYLTNEIKWPDKDIILLGRSMGSGPATYVSARRNPGALLLMSPFTSICGVVRDVAGYLASLVVTERFKNVDEIKFVMCPTLLIHGKADELIPHKHSIDLMSNCRGICHINLQEGMTHNVFNIFEDIIAPISIFFLRVGISIRSNIKSLFPKFPDSVYTKKLSQSNLFVVKKEGKRGKELMMKKTRDSKY